MNKVIRLLGVSFIAAIAFFSAPIFAEGIQGKYHFLADSDGKKANKKSIITLDFAASTFKFKAEQPGELIEDNGSYRISGNMLSISFKEMEQGSKKGAYSLNDGVLTLPFKMLDNLAGSSQWQLAGALTKNTTTKATVIDQVVSNAQKKTKLYAQVDSRAAAGAKNLKGGLAEAYYIQATLLYFKGYKWEAMYGYAKAAQLKPTNGLYLNNLSKMLLDNGRIQDAKALLEEITKSFPNLASPWGNLAYAYFKLDINTEAEVAIKKAISLDPDSGLYRYTLAKILEAKGNKKEAEVNFDKAWELGYAGNGGEGAKNAAKNSAKKPSKNKPTTNPVKSAPPSNKAASKPEDKVAVWAGNYQAKYIRSRSGETAAEANTQFGKGMTGTNMNLQTMACVKTFNMEISKNGTINGRGEILYVYQGAANSAVMGMAPGALAAANGGFAANLVGGSQVRYWEFNGTVDAEGNVEINGVPNEKLELMNVGKLQKITPWSALPPDGAGAAMKGPFHMKLQMDKANNPFIRIDQYVKLNDALIKRVHYEGYMLRSDEEIKPDCQTSAPAPAVAPPCPAREYIKTKMSLSPQDQITLEASSTYTKGDNGEVQKQFETATNVSGSADLGLLTGSVEFHQDNSYEITFGIGVNAEAFGEGSPISLSEKLEMVYDSKCGWGVKASAAAKAKIGSVASAGISVEGVIFLSKGL